MQQRLLVADADCTSAARYSAYFSDVGYCVSTATDGLDCLTKLRRAATDFLVLDQELLWGGGRGVLAWLREEFEREPIPVVLLAAVLPVAALSEWLSPPVVRCFQKPFSLASLHDCIDSALGCPPKVLAWHRTVPSGFAVDGVRQRRTAS